MKSYHFIFLIIGLAYFSCKSNRLYKFDETNYTISRPFPYKIKEILIVEKSDTSKESTIYRSFWEKPIKSINVISSEDNRKGFYITDILRRVVKDSIYSINNIIKPNHTYTFNLFNKASSNGFVDNLYLEFETNKNNNVVKWEVVDIYYRKRIKQFKKIDGEMVRGNHMKNYTRIEKTKNGKTIIRYKKSKVPKKRD